MADKRENIQLCKLQCVTHTPFINVAINCSKSFAMSSFYAVVYLLEVDKADIIMAEEIRGSWVFEKDNSRTKYINNFFC